MKGIWVLAVVCAFVSGSLLTGVSVFADEHKGNNFLCPAGKVMTGILFGGGDDDDNIILNVICKPAHPDIYLKTASDRASNDDPASVTLGCDEGDEFLSGSAWALPREDATPLEIFTNEPQVNAAGEIEWHSTARYPDFNGFRDLVVNIICLDTNS